MIKLSNFQDEIKPQNPKEFYMKLSFNNCIRALLSFFALYLLIYYWSAVSGAVLLVLGAMSSLVLGALIAYVVNIPMSFYERQLCKIRSVKQGVLTRALCMLAAILSLVGIVIALTRLVIPELYDCIVVLTVAIPPYLVELSEYLTSMDFDINTILGSQASIFNNGQPDWHSIVTNALSLFVAGLGGVMTSLITFLSATVSIIISMLLSLIFAIYLLLGKDSIGDGLERLMAAYLSENIRGKLCYVADVVDNCFHSFIVGQCTEAIILGGLCMAGMSLLGIPYATMIGALVGFTALIPIAGAYIGGGVGAFMIFTVSPVQSLVFIVFLIILQQLEGNVIYPKVVGASIGLPGILVLAAITLGGGIAGITGMLFAVPIFASIYQLLWADVRAREAKKNAEIPKKT